MTKFRKDTILALVSWAAFLTMAIGGMIAALIAG